MKIQRSSNGPSVDGEKGCDIAVCVTKYGKACRLSGYDINTMRVCDFFFSLLIWRFFNSALNVSYMY